MTAEDEVRELKRVETAAHARLIADGGRPPYSIALIDRVAQHPNAYRETLMPWQEFPENTELRWDYIFRQQLARWEDFRAWQKDNRGTLDDDEGFLAFADQHRPSYTMVAAAHRTTLSEDAKQHIEESLRQAWEREATKRRYDNHYLRETQSYSSFSDYVEHVTRRLVHHGFTDPFELCQDPVQQDQAPTWIEYLNYEYSWLDRYARSMERLERDRHEAFESLGALDVLKPHETADFLLTTDSQIQRQAELDKARRVVAFAEQVVKTAAQETNKADDGRSRFTADKASQRLAAAQARLDNAKAAFDDVMKRLKLISEFLSKQGPYQQTKRDHVRQGFLVKWALDQVAQTAETHPPPRHSPKRAMSEDGEATDSSSAHKKRRPTPPSSVPLPGATTTPLEEEEEPAAGKVGRNPKNRRKAAASDTKKPADRRRNDASPAPQAPRRSARLAAKQPTAPPPAAAASSTPAPRGKTTKPRRPAPEPQPPKATRGPVQSKGKKAVRGGVVRRESGRQTRTRAKR